MSSPCGFFEAASDTSGRMLWARVTRDQIASQKRASKCAACGKTGGRGACTRPPCTICDAVGRPRANATPLDAPDLYSCPAKSFGKWLQSLSTLQSPSARGTSASVSPERDFTHTAISRAGGAGAAAAASSAASWATDIPPLAARGGVAQKPEPRESWAPVWTRQCQGYVSQAADLSELLR